MVSKQPSSMHTSLNRFESFLSIPSSFSTTGEKYFDAPDEASHQSKIVLP